MAGFLSPEKSDLLLAASSSLLGGGTVGQQLGGIGQNIAPIIQQQREQRKILDEQNKTLQWLDKVAPEIGASVRAGQPLNLALQQYQQAQKPKTPNFINAGDGRLFNTDTQEWVQAPAGMAQDDEWGLAPVWGQDANGKTVLGQVSKSGKFKPLDTGDFTPTPVIQNLDTGTGIVGRNSRTGAVVTNTPKDLAGAERDKAIGESEGKSIAAAPGDLQAGMNAKELITSLKTDPYRERGTGGTSIFNSIPATGGYDYQNKVDQAKSGAFLTAIQQMRGLGSLSNAEGGAATAAVTRMNTATSEEAFMSALDDYEKIIDQGIARAESRMGGRTLPGGVQGTGQTRTGIKFSVEP